MQNAFSTYVWTLGVGGASLALQQRLSHIGWLLTHLCRHWHGEFWLEVPADCRHKPSGMEKAAADRNLGIEKETVSLRFKQMRPPLLTSLFTRENGGKQVSRKASDMQNCLCRRVTCVFVCFLSAFYCWRKSQTRQKCTPRQPLPFPFGPELMEFCGAWYTGIF